MTGPQYDLARLRPHDRLVALAHITADPAERAEIMAALADIAPYVGGDNQVADQLAAHVLAALEKAGVPQAAAGL